MRRVFLCFAPYDHCSTRAMPGQAVSREYQRLQQGCPGRIFSSAGILTRQNVEWLRAGQTLTNSRTLCYMRWAMVRYSFL